MSMIETGKNDAIKPLAFLRKIQPRPAPSLSDQVEAVLAEAAPRIATAYPKRDDPNFGEQFQKFAESADKLAADHNRLLEDHRVAMAENEILRARLAAQEQYGTDLRVYWEQQYEDLARENRRLSRLYHAMVGRFDAIIESLVGTRDAARREAFAPDPDAERQRQDGEAVVAISHRPGDDAPLTDQEAAEDVREHHRTTVPLNAYARPTATAAR